VTARIVPGGKGDFIVAAHDAPGAAPGAAPWRLWDKRKMRDEFPDEDELVAALRALQVVAPEE